MSQSKCTGQCGSKNIKTKLESSTLVILGLGREGLSTYKFLRKKFPSKKLILVDELVGKLTGKEWQEIEKSKDNIFVKSLEIKDDPSKVIIFKSPGIPPNSLLGKQAEELKNSGAKVTSNTNLFIKLTRTLKKNIKIIGITGTKGKSTTASIIHHVLKGCGVRSFLGGNIGIPPLSLWEKVESCLGEDRGSNNNNKPLNITNQTPTGQPIAVVLEMSSHQLSNSIYSPNIAVILDISPEHLDYYKSFEEYVKAKSQIVQFQTENDTVIFNDKQKLPTEMADTSKGKQITFNFEKNVLKIAPDSNELAIYYKNKKIIDINQLPVLGKHNVLNSIPSVIIAKKFGCETEDIGHSLKTFKTLPHRLEMVKNEGGITYVNDSLSTTPKSTIAAIKSFGSAPIILIVGGYDRNLEFSELAETINSSNVKHLVLLPDTGEKIWGEVERYRDGLGFNKEKVEIAHTFVDDMEKAVEVAKSVAVSGDIVLLSPASASFGHFRDYRDRGRQFREGVCRTD